MKRATGSARQNVPVGTTIGTTVTIRHARPQGHADLPPLRAREDRNDADECLRALLRVHGVRHDPPAQAWGLLRLLLVRVEPMPTPAD